MTTKTQEVKATGTIVDVTKVTRIVAEALNKSFIYTDDLASIIATTIITGKGCLLWGPAGHAKSEAIQTALSAIYGQEEIFTMSFGEGMSEAALWGNIDYEALEGEKKMKYDVEHSFLNYRAAVFEEIFDAPAAVLLSLKDTLTAKELRKGAQRFKMKTEAIFALTNKNPQEIAELGPSAHALIERFPLQLRVQWESYTNEDYLALFEKVNPNIVGANIRKSVLAAIANYIGTLAERGNLISPRTAVHAIDVLRKSAAARGDTEVQNQDLLKLKHIPGLEGLADTIVELIQQATQRAEAKERMDKAELDWKSLEARFTAAMTRVRGLEKAQELINISAELAQFAKDVERIQVPDNYEQPRNVMKVNALKKSAEAKEAVMPALEK